MMQLVSRADWGARPPRNREALARNKQLGTACHYSAADADEQADHANCAKRVRAIQDFHMDGRGWADIAYSYLACKHGYVYEGRGRGVRTAANGTDAGNDAYHAVCFLGDDSPDRDDVTDSGREAIRAAVLHCNAWSAADGVVPHSFFKATGCPGNDLRAWIAGGMPTAVPAAPPEEADVTKQEFLDALAEFYRQGIIAGQDSFADTYRVIVDRQTKANEKLDTLATLQQATNTKLDRLIELLGPPPEPPA